MIITTINPITGSKISQPERHPYIIEGNSHSKTQIYSGFETTRRKYISHEQDGNYDSPVSLANRNA